MDSLFLKYAAIFESHGYHLYMIGGTSRDYLLKRPYQDWDFVSEATPDQMQSFLPQADYRFAQFGSIKIKDEGREVDITTLREEGEYKDHRHPSYLHFVKDIRTDAKRRDFTINALYIDSKGRIYDFYQGLTDLEHHLIRFIGDPMKRIQEDPLRISRALRFAKTLDFQLDEQTQIAIQANKHLLKSINPEKLKMEEKKFRE